MKKQLPTTDAIAVNNRKGSFFLRDYFTKKWITGIASLCLIILLNFGLKAQVSVTATVGTLGPTPYTTLKLAFDAINAGTHQGVISISIIANTTEGATPATLNSSGAGAALYSSVLIRPTVDGVSISGNPVAGFGVIQLKGADNVIIDGDNPNSGGINRNLTVNNTTTTTFLGNSCIRIATAAAVTTADNISIRNCILNGNVTSGNISSITVATGSSGISFGIYCGGNGGATATDAPTAITSATANTAPSGTTINNLLIDNNAVNQCSRAIQFTGAATSVSNSVVISNNVIGASGTPTPAIPPYTSPATTVYTKGIWVAGTSSIAVSSNTMQNIFSYVATTITAVELASPIGATVLINNNTLTNIANNGTSSIVKAILVSNASTSYTISGNVITNVQTLAGASGTDALEVATAATSGIIESNKITTVYNRSTGTFGAFGINVSAGSNVTIKNNFVSDIKMDMTSGAAFSTTFGVHGIRILAGNGHKIYNNSVNLFGPLLGATNTTILTSALCIVALGSTIEIRNNLLSNTTTGGSTSIAHVSMFLPTSGSGVGTIINNNAYYCNSTAGSAGICHVGATYTAVPAGATTYAGLYTAALFNPAVATPSTNLRFYTNAIAANNDNASMAFTVPAPFTSATNLHIPAGTTTQLESSGASIGVTTDIDNDARPGPTGSVNGGATAPDIGADEFDGIPATPCMGAPTPGTITGASAVCFGTGTTLTLSGASGNLGITYQWKSGTTMGGPYPTLLGTGLMQATGNLTVPTYFVVDVTCTNMGGSTTTTPEKSVLINPLPTVMVSPTSGSVCSPGGMPVTLTASGASTYTWSPTTGLTPTTGAVVSANPSSTLTYTVTGIDLNGCGATATATVSVTQTPQNVTAVATPASICTGNSSNLTSTGYVQNTSSVPNTYTFNGATGSYTPISGTTVTLGSQDDGFTGNLPIGFTFIYNGIAQTVFAASPNAWIQLGQTTSSSSGGFTNALASTANFIAPLWDDNNMTGGNIQYITTGSIGSRVLTVQWTNMHVGNDGNTGQPTISLQVKLYETSGIIQLIYGSTSAALTLTTASIGITGNSGNYLSVTPLSPPNTSTVSSVTENSTATDGCGNSATASQLITVIDNTAPVITGSISMVSVEGCTAASKPPAVTTVAALEALGVQITDACSADAALTVTNTDVVTGTCPIVVKRTYRVTDGCGNSSTTLAMINITDTTPPTGPASLSGGFTTSVCKANAIAMYPFTLSSVMSSYSDNCPGALSITLTNALLIGDNCLWILTYTFMVEDHCGNVLANRKITYTGSDQTAPTGNAPPPSVGNSGCKASAAVNYPFNPAVAVEGYTDNCGTVTAVLTNTLLAGSDDCNWGIVYVFKVVDECGNSLQSQQMVITGSDQTPPTFTKPADISIYTNAPCVYNASVAVTGDVTNEQDNCATGLNAIYTDEIADGPCECSHIISRTWTLTDACGNAATNQVQTITVYSNIVTNTNDSGPGSLRSVVSCVPAGATVTFAPSLMDQMITLTSGEILINKNLTIAGMGMSHLTISGNMSSRIFNNLAGNTFCTKNLMLKDGSWISHGGAICSEGTLVLENVMLMHNYQNGVPKAFTLISPGGATIVGTVEVKN